MIFGRDVWIKMKTNKSRGAAPSFDTAPLPLLNSPDYVSSKPQLNHLFIDNEYFSEPWHSDSFMNVSNRLDLFSNKK
jgi:hypothetical protein